MSSTQLQQGPRTRFEEPPASGPHRRPRAWRGTALLALLLVAGAPAAAMDPKEVEEVAAIIRQQRQEAAPQSLFLPYFSLAGRDTTEVFFVSTITDPIVIDLVATSPAGKQVHLGRETLQPSRHLALDLRTALAEAGGTFPTGNLRLDFVAPAGAMQAWAVVKSGRQTFEVPSVGPGKVAGTELLTYWDPAAVGPRRNLRVQYFVTNTTDQEVTYTLTQRRGRRVVGEQTATLGPLQSRAHVLGAGRPGWLRLSHDGPSGALLGAGVVSAAERLAYLPLAMPSGLAPGPRFEVLRVPEEAGARGGKAAPARTSLTLFNTGDAPQRIEIDRLTRTGAPRGTRPLTLAAKEVVSVDVEKLFGRSAAPGGRLRVRGSAPSLLVDGAVVTADGEVLALSVHPASTAHQSGTYPIPDPDRFAVRTTLINLGDEEAEILAQYFWEGGTYAVAAQKVPAGGTLVIEPAALAARGEVDMMDRKLDPQGKNLMLKWIVRRGPGKLIARTEARPLGGADGFGFNCGGCCWQIPHNGILPGEVELGLGESPSFEAMTWYDTCSGTIGPWSADPWSSNIPTPFSWDYFNLSVSSAAEATIDFGSEEYKLGPGCAESYVPRVGSGRGKACDKIHNPTGYDRNETCVEQTSNCTSCNNCCMALHDARVCKNGSVAERDLARSERTACETQCLIDLCS